MADRTLIPIDGSEQSWEAFDYALRERSDDELVVLNVINPVEGAYGVEGMTGDYWESWYEDANARAERLFEDARDRASDHEGGLSTAVETGPPARTIVEYAEEEGLDHVVMGSHGRSGVSRILLGSVAESVVRRATVPVTIVR